MKHEWIEPYVMAVAEKVSPPGNLSFSRSLSVALSFAFNDQAQDKIPVLFVLLKQNYWGYGCVMMNGEAYTCYPSEGEMLLMEGFPIRILGFENNVVINNKHESLKEYYSKQVMVVYLYLDR